MRRVLLLRRKFTDPAFHFGRELSATRQGDRWLNPPVMSHWKRFHPLPASSISDPRAFAAIGEQDCTNHGRIGSVAVPIRIGIDNCKHVRVLVRNIGIIAAAQFGAPVHAVCPCRSRDEGNDLIGCRVDYRHVIRGVDRWPRYVCKREYRRGRPFLIRTHRRLDRSLK